MNYKKILSTITGVAGLLIVAVLTWVITPGLARAQRNFEEVSDIVMKTENLWIPFMIMLVCVILISSLIGLKLVSLESGVKKGASLGLMITLLIASIMATTKDFDFLLLFKILGSGITAGVVLLNLAPLKKKVVH